MSSQNRFKLFHGRRFAPFFWTQFLGAFNDNVFKNALIILIAYSSVSASLSTSNTLSNLAQALFILPYFLLSPLAGQFADKFEKSRYIRYTKLFEILIMTLAAVAFYYQKIYLLLGLLFCLGGQATFFGPVK
jgi:MFS family permease